MKHILCYGDSNTWGYNAESGTRFPFEQRWTGRLSHLLPADFRIIEEGLCGRTTAYDLPLEPGRNGYTYYPIALSSADPVDLVVIMLGTNDRRVQLLVTPEESALAMERYIALSRTPEHWLGHHTPQLLLVSPPAIVPTVLDTKDGFYYNKTSIVYSQQLKVVYRKVAERYGCHFLDAAAFCEPGNDHIHLAAEGHRCLADAIAQKILTLFGNKSADKANSLLAVTFK